MFEFWLVTDIFRENGLTFLVLHQINLIANV